MNMRKLVGRNFARPRLAKDFTQEHFAELSGFTQQYVSGLERGRRNPTVVTLYHLAQALSVSHVELITPDEEALREAARARSGNADLPPGAEAYFAQKAEGAVAAYA
jgi:transcriptional regulator with XRE-family HTH domain